MTRPTGKVNSAIIVTKKYIHLLITQTRIIKGTMTTTSPIPVKKVNPVLKTRPKIRGRLRRISSPYKLR